MNEHIEENIVVIVYPEKLEGMSSLLATLISERYNEKYEVVEWDEKHWRDNKATTSNSQKVVLLGKAGENIKYGMKWHFNKFSMKYGWSGGRAILDVGLLNPLDIKEFHEYAQQHAEEAKASLKNMAGAAGAGVGIAGAAGGIAKLAGLLAGIKLLPVALVGAPVAAAIYLNRFKKVQFPLLVKEFALEGGFNKFMEE